MFSGSVLVSEFYTHVFSDWSAIYYRGYDGKKRVQCRITDFKPTLFVPGQEPTEYHTCNGTPLQKITFDSIRQASQFYQENQSHEQMNAYVYGNSRWHYVYLFNLFRDGVHFDSSVLRRATIDIETDSSKGFADPQSPFAAIISITIRYQGRFYVFGLKPCNISRDDVRYVWLPDERSMLLKFVQFFEKLDIDILYGWNTDQYDIPYMINRLNRIFDDKLVAERLSPWGKINRKFANFRGKNIPSYDIMGIASLDYIDLYRRYMPKSERDSLKFVAEHELGETKVEYEGSLHDLYTKDYDKFIEYNIQDVALVDKIDAKLKLSDVVITTAYDSLINYVDVQQQVRMWDAINFHEMVKRKLVIPPVRAAQKEHIEGAYVLPAKVGKHKWVVSFDFASLYPSLIIEHNISPDTAVSHFDMVLHKNKRHTKFEEDTSVVSDDEDLSELKKQNLVGAGNGVVFSRKSQGFLPTILQRLFEERMLYKKKMKEAQKLAVSATDAEVRAKHEADVAKYQNYQSAKKIQLNSAYGSFGNVYCRFYDPSMAEAVTLSGRSVLLRVYEVITEQMRKKYGQNITPIVYGDTDSLYISAHPYVKTLPVGLSSPEIVEKIDKEFCDEIQEYIQIALTAHRDRFNTYAPKLEMVRDVISEDSIFVSKKRYVMEIWDKEGTRYNSPVRKAIGLEMVKSTTPKFFKGWLENAVSLVLKGEKQNLSDLTDQYEKEMRNVSLDIFSHPVNVSDIEKWVDDTGELKKGAPIQVTAAYAFNAFLEKNGLTKKYDKIKSGQRMRYFHLKNGNPYRAHVMGVADQVPNELNLEEWVDRYPQYEKIFLKPLNMILEAVGWTQKGETRPIENIFDDGEDVIDFFKRVVKAEAE